MDRGKPVNLVYVGQIREKESGRVVREPAYFMVTEKRSGMTFPFVNDRPGHYRSPDIGESVEELAGTAVNPADLEFEVSVAGYKNVKLTNAPRRNKGVVEMNFRVEREGGPAAAAAAAGEGAPPASDLIDHSTQAARRRADGRLERPIAQVPLLGHRRRRDHCRSSGAYIRPPSVHSPLSRRSSRIGLCLPTLRSKISP